MQNMKKNFWFWAEIVLGTVRKANLNNPRARCEVWTNLVIINAPNPRKALQKAEQIGKQGEQEKLNQCGELGWELVTVVPKKYRGHEYTFFYLRRQISTDKSALEPRFDVKLFAN